MSYYMVKQKTCVEWEQQPESSQSSGSDTPSTQSILDKNACNSANTPLKRNYRTLNNSYNEFSKSPGKAAARGVNLNINLVKSNIIDLKKYCTNQNNKDLIEPIQKKLKFYNMEADKWRKSSGAD